MSRSPPTSSPTNEARPPGRHGERRAQRGDEAGALRLELLKGFQLSCDDRRVSLPMAAQRVVAFLALQGRPVHRLFVAGHLWIDASEQRATASLRTALWRLARSRAGVVASEGQTLRLSPSIAVDVDAATRRARCIIHRAGASEEGDRRLLGLADELLPDWYEDWVLIERERFRQLRLHALEILCDMLVAEGRFADAADAGLAAIAGEPLRESAHRALIAAYLAEGNPSEALRHYGFFRRLLAEQLGLVPSPLMESLVEPVRNR